MIVAKKPVQKRKTTVMLPPAVPVDRRRSPRYACRTRCMCSSITLAPNPPYWPAQTYDLNEGSVGLLAEHPVPAGTFLMLYLKSRSGAVMHRIRIRVERIARRGHKRQFELGCRFLSNLSEAQLTTVLAEFSVN